MSFEERMQQLGRRAVEQEPAELALPRCIRAAECVKPVSCVNYRIERHGFGEGRLPIPSVLIKDKDARHNASTEQQHQHDSDHCCFSPGKTSARKAGKLLRPSQQQARQQVDAVKARKSAAKAYSDALDRRNAELLQNSNSNGSKGAGPAPAHADENHPATPGHVSRRVSVSQQPLDERHIPPKRGSNPTSAAAETSAASVTAAEPAHLSALMGADAGAHAAPHASDAYCSNAAGAAQLAAVSLPADGAAAAAAEGGAHAAQGVEGNAQRTFLTGATSQPPSPMPARPSAADAAGAAAAAPAHGVAAQLDSSSVEGSPVVAANAAAMAAAAVSAGVMQDLAEAASAPPAGTALHSGSLPVDLVVCESGSSKQPALAVATVPSGSAGQHREQFSSTDASSRLLLFSHSAPDVPRSLASPAAAAVGPCAVSPSVNLSVSQHSLQQPCSRSLRPGSPNRQLACSPHWSPVPPRTQLQPPVVVRPMANWACEQEPLQQTSHCTQAQQAAQEQGHATGHQQQQVTAVDARPPWQGARGAGSTTAGTLKAEVSEYRSTSRNERRHVSISVATVRSSGLKKGRISSSGGLPAAAFSSPELAKMAAAAAEKAAKRLDVLPALCSCGHGTSVLDPSYPRHCCSNCPLRGNITAYEQLLTGLLAGMGF